MKIKLISVIITLVFMCGCSQSIFKSKKQTLDDRNAFLVRPLIIPENVSKSLKHGSAEFNENENINDSFRIIYNKDYDEIESINKNTSLTKSDKVFLEKLGVKKELPNVRQQVNKETLGIVKKQDSFIKKVLRIHYNEKITNPITEYSKLN